MTSGLLLDLEQDGQITLAQEVDNKTCWFYIM